MGRVRSYKRLDHRGDPKLMKLRMRKGKPNQPLYWVVHLVDDWGFVKSNYVHRLVLKAFRPWARCDELQGAHIDGNSLNNWLSNLKWATQTENEADKIAHDRVAQGEKHGHHKLTEKQALIILNVTVWKRGMVQEFADKFGVGQSAISKVKNGKRWSYLNE
jgi:hypothetical protein